MRGQPTKITVAELQAAIHEMEAQGLKIAHLTVEEWSDNPGLIQLQISKLDDGDNANTGQ